MPLEAAFEDISEGVTLVVFKPVGASHDSPLRPESP
jgi:hypothetical protein